MPFSFKTKKGKSKSQQDLDVGTSNGKDPFSDVGFFRNGTTTTETYTGGVAPVTITVDENDEALQESPPLKSKRSWKQRKPMEFFVDQNGKDLTDDEDNQPRKRVGSGDLVGAKKDLDFCCIQDGAIDCFFGSNNKLVLCGGEDEGGQSKQYSYKKYSKNASRRTSRSTTDEQDDNDDIEKIRNICPIRGGDENTTATAMSNQDLDAIRCIGPIADQNESKSCVHYLDKCAPKPSPEKATGMSKKRFRIVLAISTFALLALIAGVVAMALRKQTNENNGKNKITYGHGGNTAREKELFSILDLTSTSDWETPGSPQNQALYWLANDDRVALSLDNDEEIKERFAAATLYFATDGPESWKTSLGFLGANSICNWNDDNGEGLNGIFCQDGRVNEINIVGNNLKGTLPNELNYFSEMAVLNMFYNKLTGSIPDLSYLVNLEQLDLDGNELSGSTPASLFNLPSLTNLFLLYNKNLSGSIPEIEDSSKLVAISLIGCSFVGTLPKSLGNIQSLRLLQLKDNELEGSIPSKLFSLPKLETLNLEGNQLSGVIPPVVPNEMGTVLESLSLGSNRLEGALPNGLRDLTNLKYLYAENNMLTGSIRNAIMDLPNLEQLRLQGNSFSGDISYFLSESKALAEVYLGNNNFSGDLGDFLQFVPPTIERLDLSQNHFIEGPISVDIGNFGSLKYFNVSSCTIGGEIPPEIGRLSGLETLDLSDNNLQGEVPEEIANMKSLSTFDISQNRDLVGDLSASLCKERNDFVFALADCSGDVRVECDCCTHCCNKNGVCGPK